ncbi:hypothetical protein BDZ94DRAFT_1260497 [Collybia nuda]|uniref:F-box domain-containing protein n=1 Tax=Collybia nuda TaxID=64659 RepID=A0A9P5Y7P1_9AGAR|nr:hypothetical protein BDZ94DRAFT_1260497 [Collybia nuda]
MESRFAPVLFTNYVPSNHELDEIHDLLIDSNDKINQIDTEIWRLHQSINELHHQRTELDAFIASHEALTAPMRRIPQEILQEIFVSCLPTRHNAVMSDTEAPLLLGRVCSQWRKISLSTPRLWSSMHLTFATKEPEFSWGDESPIESMTEDWNLHVEAVQAWLGRSGCLPLSISLFCPSRGYPLQYEEYLLETLNQFAHRWKNLILIVSSTPLPIFPSLSREAAPLLETLSFHNITNKPSSGIPSLDIFHAPLLQTVSSSHLRCVPAGMNWSRLTSLSLESHGPGSDELNPSNALAILRSSPSLTFCRLEFGWNTAYTLNGDVVTMPVLKTLSINEGTSILNSFFEHLRFPALVNLEFTPSPPDTYGEMDSSSSPSILILLPRIDRLEELTLSANNMFPATLSECLKHLPHITRLSILNNPTLDWHIGWPSPSNTLHVFNDYVVTLLTPHSPIGDQPLPVEILCPRLKILECNPGSVSDAALLLFIQQRTTHASLHDVQRLKRVEINFRRQKEIDILSVLSPDVLAETQISLKYFTYPTPSKQYSARAGLEEGSRLELPTKAFRYLYT